MSGKGGEGKVKTSNSKTKSVSSWRCQRQAGAMKALQRGVWSFIFLVYGVHSVKAEEQGSQVQLRMSEKYFYQIHQVNFPWTRMLHWGTSEGESVEGTLCKEEKKRWTARERTQGLLKKIAKAETSEPLKQTARKGTWEPWKSRGMRMLSRV